MKIGFPAGHSGPVRDLFLFNRKLRSLLNNAPRRSHCGGKENVAFATRRRRESCKAGFFLILLRLSRSVFILRGGTEFLQPGKNLRVRSPVRRGLLRESRGEERRRKLPDTDNYRGFWLFSRKF